MLKHLLFLHRFLPVCIIVISLISPPVSGQRQLEQLDRDIASAKEVFGIPGLAVGIIKDGEIVLKKGYGMRHAGEALPVGTETVFGIASCTKAFTATCIGMLADDGLLDWNDPVSMYLPEFRLHDPAISRMITIADLLCHRSGLETFDGDLLWYGTDYTREEVVRKIQFRETTQEFRSEFGYQNVMYIAAGLVIEKITGKSWDDFVSERIFQPLGMTRSTTSNAGFTLEQDVSFPHHEGSVMEFINYDNCGPAASVHSSVDDLLKWVGLWLNGGSVNGKQLISPETMHALTSSHTMMGDPSGTHAGGTHFRTYGLGWFLFDYEGRKVIEHGGGLPGIHTKVVLVPEENLGFVILANQISGLVEALYRHILDFYLADEPGDWIKRYLEGWNRIKEDADQEKRDREASRVQDTRPTLPLEKYTGSYTDTMYGPAEITLSGDILELKLIPTGELFSSPMEHWHYNTFRIKFIDPFLPQGFVTFTVNGAGNADSFTIDLPNPDFHFHKLKFTRTE
ncbi:MAG: serine hydrolase [Bacteroidales bacterium]|nr:serine hydrolase [Bacteroidales bacterium]